MRHAPPASTEPRIDAKPGGSPIPSSPSAPVTAAPREVPPPQPGVQAAAPELRQTSLLNRTGLGRTGQGKGSGHGSYAALRGKVHRRLVEELAGNTDSAPPEVVRQRIAELVNEIVVEQAVTMSRHDRQRIIEIVINDVLGLGPLEALQATQQVPESLVNAYR